MHKLDFTLIYKIKGQFNRKNIKFEFKFEFKFWSFTQANRYSKAATNYYEVIHISFK